MTIYRREDYWVAKFKAMGCPCEILIDSEDRKTVTNIVDLTVTEAQRIEQKFSRYKKNNIIYKINSSCGQPVEIDQETQRLLEYANQCYQLSDGKFDISSGVLREIWSFDGSDRIPTQRQVEELLHKIGWERITLSNGHVIVPTGMEIDVGGIGKEYAVDKIALMIDSQFNTSVTVNFGGDIFVTRPRKSGQFWRIGVDDPTSHGVKNLLTIKLPKGGIATSGDANRYLLRNGVRYSHILDPKTGWPIQNAPRSVTVMAKTCTEAGIMATFAMLEGSGACDFLAQQEVRYWCF